MYILTIKSSGLYSIRWAVSKERIRKIEEEYLQKYKTIEVSILKVR